MEANDIKFKPYRLLKKFTDGLKKYALSTENLFDMFLETYTLLKFNEFEMALWILILEKVMAKETECSIKELINYCAYSAKVLTNKDVGAADVEMEEAYPGFYMNVRKWMKKYPEINWCTPQEINKKYQELSLSILCENEDYYINYGKIVEELVNTWMKVKEETIVPKEENPEC